jgi:hypothetical protein
MLLEKDFYETCCLINYIFGTKVYNIKTHYSSQTEKKYIVSDIPYTLKRLSGPDLIEISARRTCDSSKTLSNGGDENNKNTSFQNSVPRNSK